MYSKYGPDINESMKFLASNCTEYVLNNEKFIKLTHTFIKPFEDAKKDDDLDLELVLNITEEYINFLVIEPNLEEIYHKSRVYQNNTTIDLSSRESPLSLYTYVPEIDGFVNEEDEDIIHIFKLHEFGKTISNHFIDLNEENEQLEVCDLMEMNCIDADLDDEKYEQLRDEFLEDLSDCMILSLAITKNCIQLLACGPNGDIIKGSDVYYNLTSFNYEHNPDNICYISFVITDLENPIPMALSKTCVKKNF